VPELHAVEVEDNEMVSEGIHNGDDTNPSTLDTPGGVPVAPVAESKDALAQKQQMVPHFQHSLQSHCAASLLSAHKFQFRSPLESRERFLVELGSLYLVPSRLQYRTRTRYPCFPCVLKISLGDSSLGFRRRYWKQ
jgi:hypothetical protein